MKKSEANIKEAAETEYNLGISLGKQGKYEQAIKAFDTAIKLNSKDPDFWNEKGIVLYESGKPKDAIKAFDKAIKLSSTHGEDFLNNMGVAFYKIRKFQDAVNAFDKAITIHISNINIAKIPTADKTINDKITIQDISNINIARIWNNNGKALYELGKYDEAIRAYRTAIDKDPDLYKAYSNMGLLFLELGNLDGAFEKANEALSKNNTDYSALFLHGRINIEKGEYDNASEYFMKAINFYMGEPLLILFDAYANYLKAELSIYSSDKQKRMISIIMKLEKAEKMCKIYEKEKKAYILYFLGCSYFRSQDFFSAKEKLQECIRWESSIKSSASELLENIWDYQIRPSVFHWWLDSPINRWIKRVVFIIISLFIFLLLLVPTFVLLWFPSYEINETLYIFSIILLIFFLLLPRIDSIKTADIEIKIRSPPISDFGLSAAKIGEKLYQKDK